MSYVPSRAEWDVSRLEHWRQAYLNNGRSFEEIVDSIIAEAVLERATVEPYRTAPCNESGKARQVCFLIRIKPQTYDLFYNSADGLRGRYWQNPQWGDLATNYLIDALKPLLLKSVEDYGPDFEMSVRNVEDSLDAASAKVWVYEGNGSKISSQGGPQIVVPRWAQNESKLGSKGQQWRWSPCDDQIEIKGALIDPEGIEHIPESKRDRANQIYMFGFT